MPLAENQMTIEELRREVRLHWDTQWALITTLRELPEIPPYEIMILLSEAAKYPDDHNIGKRIQREKPGSVFPKSEAEGGMGIYYRIRQGLLASRNETGT